MTARIASIVAASFAVVTFAACGGVGKSQQHLRSAVEGKKPTLDDCYASALKRDNTINGSVTMWLHVKKDKGTVTKMEVIQSGVNDVELMRCVEGAIVGTKVEPKPSVNMKVQYELQLTPKAGGPVSLRLVEPR